ncbi:MAG: hypothetical protein F6K16_33215 [Symploca sp. SIO2B6]|nr:hypothetical protein [Symploca sp. SIO2B6]
MSYRSTLQFFKKRQFQRLTLYGVSAIVVYGVLVKFGFIFPISLLPEVLCFTSCEVSEQLHPDEWVENDGVNDQAIATLLPSNFQPKDLTVLIEPIFRPLNCPLRIKTL